MSNSLEEENTDDEVSQEFFQNEPDEKTEKVIDLMEKLQKYVNANGLNMLTGKFATSDMEMFIKK